MDHCSNNKNVLKGFTIIGVGSILACKNKLLATAITALATIASFLLSSLAIGQPLAKRVAIDLNSNWRTVAGNDEKPVAPAFQTKFDDSKWKLVTVPHNWDDYHGYRRLLHGNKHGDAWYRRTVKLKQSKAGKRFFLFFEGVGSYATVYLNEQEVGVHAGGRTTFTIDVTNYIKTDGTDNLLAVRAWHPLFIKDLPWVCGGCSDERGFSEGSQPMGIFRPVQLIVTNDLRIEPFGVHAWATLNGNAAVLNINTTIKNYSTQRKLFTVIHNLVDKNGTIISTVTEKGALKATGNVELSTKNINVAKVNLWSVEDPYLYKIVSIIKVGSTEIDRLETDFGFRTVNWKTATNQFYLNGKPVFINGVAEYEHLVGQSHAFSKEQVAARVKWMEAAGFNAFRDGHQPHNLLYGKLFNHKGILWWTQLSAHVWYDTPEFKANFKQLLKEWVIERRNDPSVVLWGLQNESKIPEAFAKECTQLIRELDPTSASQRLVTTCNGGEGTDWDVPQNWTGTYGGNPNTYGEDLKKQVLVGEYGAWRTLDLHTEGGYQQNGPVSEDRFTQLMEKKVRLAESVKDSVAGHFFWLLTSHDNPGRVQGGEGLRELDRIGPVNYKGMLTPWEEPTDIFYMFRSNYIPAQKEPMVYIASHTWPNRWMKPGLKDSIMVYSNCEAVELFNDLGQVSLGKQKHNGFGTHFIFNKANIQYNILYAVGYVNGKPVARDTIFLDHLPEAPGVAALRPSKTSLLKPKPGMNYVYRVNCGGADYFDEWGSKWSADKALPPNAGNKYWGSSSWTNAFDNMPAFFASQRRTNTAIKGTKDWELFQSFRYGLHQLYYQFPVPNGSYEIELYFVEPWLGVGGSMEAGAMRLFDVAVNGQTVIEDLDIWKEAGVNKALKKTVTAKVSNGLLRISFPNTKAGQAIIAAIAIASVNKKVRPVPAFEMIGDLKCDGCVYNAWLDEGDKLFTNQANRIYKLAPALFGADWISLSQMDHTKLRFVANDTLDVYMAIAKEKASVLKDFERLSDSIISDEAGGKKYDIYRKRVEAGREIVIDQKNIALIGILPATNMQPAYDLKPTTSYKADVAVVNHNVDKELIAGGERTVVKNNDHAEITWPITTGVADVYSITIKYNSPLEQDVTGTIQLFDVGNNKMADEPVVFKTTRPGKWSYITMNTGSMINAGNYKVKLITRNANGLIVSNIDIQ
ncbi:malectin domain-containing carbohydrate-binding protein [Niabella sp. 22666]|uniref:malectin domain-containing carbohydrate-binding protein n=1 Tax=Niabella sp. 22666 TaxID=3453954 RepID=UPI003F855BC2